MQQQLCNIDNLGHTAGILLDQLHNLGCKLCILPDCYSYSNWAHMQNTHFHQDNNSKHIGCRQMTQCMPHKHQDMPHRHRYTDLNNSQQNRRCTHWQYLNTGCMSSAGMSQSNNINLHSSSKYSWVGIQCIAPDLYMLRRLEHNKIGLVCNCYNYKEQSRISIPAGNSETKLTLPSSQLVVLEEGSQQILPFYNNKYKHLYIILQHIINISMNKNSNDGLNYKVYWQKQGLDSLCGVHCINSLLQGPFFDEIALSHLALQLDKKEHELMAAEGMTSDLIKYMKEESGNVAMDGNYSIQVLQEALKTMNLSMVSIEALGQKDDLNNKKAFICNNAAHWIAIRKINGVWYNLNSLGMRLPEIISDFYLSAFIMSVKECGFQVFSVQGDFPPAKQEQFQHVNDHQEWYPAKRIKKYQEKKMKRKGYKPNISGGGTDKQMEKAIAISLGKKYQSYKSSGQDSDWDDDNKKKQIKPFAGTGVSMAGDTYIHYDKFEIGPQDVEMISIMKMAIEEKLKAEIKEGVDVIFRLPDGKKKSQKFSPEEPISNLYDFIWVDRNPHSRFYLVDMGSKNKLLDLQIPIMSIEDPNDHTVMVNVCDV